MLERLRRLPEAARALGAARALAGHDDWDAGRLAAYQRERLVAMVRYAAGSSPFYRERFAGIELSDDLDPAELPTLDKAMMLENFDDLVLDRRLTLAGVEAHLEDLERAAPGADPRLFGEYRVMASGGTEGRRGVFVYSRSDWSQALAGLIRVNNEYVGLSPRLPRRRAATVMAASQLHMSARMLASIDVGGQRMLRLDARAPLNDLIEALNDFQPESLSAYASIAAQLAERRLAGDLQISPRVVITTSEVRTAEMEEKIVSAFGGAPFNTYASTETGVIAADCGHHAGMHTFGDLVQIEVVDEEHRPVAAGELGSRLLVTNLFNRTQPLIRYELTDLATLSPDPCPCGRPFPLLGSLDGRSDDMLELATPGGNTVKVHPLTMQSPLVGVTALSDYKIIQAAGELRVEAVLKGGGAGQQTCQEIQSRLEAALAERGVEPPPIRVERVDRIARHPQSGKLKLIEVQKA